ncbi:ATP-binding cassette domain-containing protein [Tuwongella immobilis]|uniref:ABC transporter domain-containing protein n=1 Tax=Tuwongella immobilis TaxID=692036 RepID=A0A6C2YUD1_9BACT|nr:ATP-binding cassette domain-containing protein [Tuwongella immobilis]VIP05230.1 abc transporter atpase : ABC-type multidrug transport system, ATPase component OS=Thiorhodovibrio sp. 970 GN=Thi970DRAFT_03799 PE=4 SV=1: FHA: ABC_tran: ABC2_membrane [Tuwongella immobilis]VTS07816.1 abc transporter atpase : ABC-type multidrug transport system, ATPase component OS=Thiorhodovibrio sp. 970 GN=Thi970DRAFT_03799 PE=4 SV=1: FHA: ABC_tran: ABC2_membrane [Tuwongella immobilis]
MNLFRLTDRSQRTALIARRQVTLKELFGNKDRLIIGRDPQDDVCLPHPSISRNHAVLTRHDGEFWLTDLGSVNGSYVNGVRIREQFRLKEGDQIAIGPYLFSIVADSLISVDSSRSIRLEARNLEKVVRTPSGQPKTLLADINLVVEPGEFISLLGPSGSGKSTLMDCLNGRRQPTNGAVLANGEDFYDHLIGLSQSIGYVPQKDIIHTQLTVERALYYTALLRLPRDTSPAEIDQRLDQVIRQMELEPHRATLVSQLSGGQIKRVSLGAELIAEPSLLYIDEATSGLDAGTEARMMHLFRKLSDEGRSVVCITHNIENVDVCHLVLILVRGRIAYIGPPSEAPGYFGVNRVSAIYDRLDEKEPEVWQAEFRQSPYHEQYVVRRINSPLPMLIRNADGAEQVEQLTRSAWMPIPLPTPELTAARQSKTQELTANEMASLSQARERLKAKTEAAKHSSKDESGITPHIRRLRQMRLPRLPFFQQFPVLLLRYMELLWHDRRSLILTFCQAPMIAACFLLGFYGKPFEGLMVVPRQLITLERDAASMAVQQLAPSPTRTVLEQLLASDTPLVPTEVVVDPRYNYTLIFILCISVLWLGCNNSAKEIVKESAVYGRERAVNLSIPPYLLSKFVLQTLLSGLQTVLLVGCVYGFLEIAKQTLGTPVPHPGYHLPYDQMIGIFLLLSTCGVAMGLALSAFVGSSDQATALLPYLLIPQFILGGGIITIDTQPLSWLPFLGSPVYWAYRAVRTGETSFPSQFPFYQNYDDSLVWPCLGLAVQTLALMLAAAYFLRRKDVAN